MIEQMTQNVMPQHIPQSIPQRIFRVNYREGFALIHNLEYLPWLIEKNSDVHVCEMPDIGLAYTEACVEYTLKKFDPKSPTTPILPKFENVVHMPFHSPGFTPQIPPSDRFFATMHHAYIGIFDTIQGAIEFMSQLTPSTLQEFPTSDDATAYFNRTFVLPMLALSAYVTDDIPYITSMPINFAVPIAYRQWWLNHLKLVSNLPFQQPKFLAPAGTK